MHFPVNLAIQNALPFIVSKEIQSSELVSR